MEQITVRLSTEVIEELDRIAEESDRSRAEVIRDELNPEEGADEVDRLRDELASIREEHEREITALKEQYEEEIAELERENERLKNEKRLILEQREEHAELQQYVADELSYREAGLGTRMKWWLFGKGEK